MRPLRLELKGFTCFKDAQAVSFADLDLFAIQGPTGAGKSSILDAITYALFGQTSRLGGRGLEALVSQGASQMAVTLEFEASDGGRYRAIRVWSKKDKEKQNRFEKLVNGAWGKACEATGVKELNAEIEKVVGLDFDGFTKAMLLPQGEFDRFLKGDARERRELLKSLADLHQLEAMRERASGLARDLKGQIDQLTFLLEGEYAGATREAAEALEAELLELDRTVARTGKRLERVRSDLIERREAVRLGEELEGVRAKLGALEARRAEIEAAADAAALARRAAGVLPRLEAAERAGRALEAAEADAVRRTLAAEAAVAHQARAGAEFEAATAAAAELPALEASQQKLAALGPKAERLRELGSDLEADHEEPLDYSEAEMNRLEGLAARLGEFKRVRTGLEAARRELAEAGRAREEAEADLAAQRAARANCLARGLEARAEVERLEAELALARRDAGAAELVRRMQPGDPCPVCGKPVRLLPDLGPSRVPGLEADLKVAGEVRQNLLGEHGRLGEAVKGAERGLEGAGREVARAEARRAELERDSAELSAAFAEVLGPHDDPRAALHERRSSLLAGLARDIREETGGREPADLVREISRRRTKLKADEANARDAWEAARAALTVARAGLEAAGLTASERRAEAEARRAELEAALAASGLADAARAKAAALAEPDIERLERRVREHRDALTAGLTREADLLELLGGRVPDPAGLAALTAEEQALDTERRAAEAEAARTRHRIAETRRRAEKALGLERERAGFVKRLNVYAQLAQDLRGNEFQEYMLAQVQRELLARASSLMGEVTRGRYRLELLDGEYHVLDGWNGLEPRSVKTLSGGESFIASLSLALALSDYLAGHKALGALFLDEGFGTLDAEALDSVAAVLETIQTQGRMVGVITHVSSLAERLPSRIVVEKGPASSQVRLEA